MQRAQVQELLAGMSTRDGLELSTPQVDGLNLPFNNKRTVVNPIAKLPIDQPMGFFSKHPNRDVPKNKPKLGVAYCWVYHID